MTAVALCLAACTNSPAADEAGSAAEAATTPPAAPSPTPTATGTFEGSFEVVPSPTPGPVPSTEAAAPTPGSSAPAVAPTPSPTPSPAPPITARLDPLTTPGPGPRGLEVVLPDDPSGAPTVVLVHGGAWLAGSPDSLAALAAGLADRGAIAVNLSYSTLLQQGGHPRTFDELACGIRQARAIGEDLGGSGEVVLAGHSAGAHLAMVVALDEGAWGGDCPFDGSAAPDRFVGLAGVYDIDAVDVVMRAFLGGDRTQIPEVWDAVDPHALVVSGVSGVGDFPVRFHVGDQDTLAPERVSQRLADELVAAGADATVELLPGVDHFEIMTPSVSADLVLAD